MQDYSLLFVIQFCWEGDQSAQGLCWFCSLGWLGELCMVHGAHLFVLSNDKQAGLELVAVLAAVAVAAVKNGSKFSV
jgi:hypothetical protein